MAAYEVLLLNTAIPQIQAAQSGDTYVVPRDIAFSAALTLSAGTANGVPYLNGSKVLTTGSALVFDGSNLGIGTSPNTKLNLYTVSGNNRIRVQSASQESYFGTDGTNTAIAWYGGDLTFGFSSNNGAITSEYMRLTSTGLGIGTNNPGARVHSSVSSSGATSETLRLDNPSDSTNAGTKLTYRLSGWSYEGGFVSLTRDGSSGGTIMAFGTSANASTTNASAKMTLDASGRLGIGITSPSYTQQIQSSTTSSGATPAFNLVINRQNSSTEGLFLGMDGNADAVIAANNSALRFGTVVTGAYSERARITSGGYFKAQGASTYINSAGSYHEFVANVDNNEVLAIQSKATNGTQYGVSITTNNDQNDATRWFLICRGAGTDRAIIRSNGGLANYSANNVNLASDERLKKDISPLATTWDKLKQIEVVNFRYKDCNEGDPLLYGVIAQQVQPIVPELVVVTREAKEATEDQEATPEYYGIREQPMYWLAIKALQEAMARIETLEAEVAALKGA